MSDNDLTRKIQAKLDEMQNRYGAQLSERFDEVDGHWMSIVEGAATRENWGTFYKLIHRFSGSGATFGFPIVSETARLVEAAILPLFEAARPPTGSEVMRISTHLESLGKACRNAGEPARRAVAAAVATPAAPKRILIVDDDIHVADYIATMLSEHGYQTEKAAYAAAAEVALEKCPADLVILDVYLPDGFGMDVARRLRERFSAKLPIFFISTQAAADSIRGQEIPSGEFLLKPIDDAVLLDMTKRFLK